MRILVALFIAFLLLQLPAQTPKYRVVSIPVEKNGSLLKQPWTGGMNSPQFSPIELNGDTLPDLFVFDRVGDKVLTFLNTGTTGDTTYQYAPQYESIFPADLTAWALIRDYNYDNVPDIFTRVNLGTRVFKGSYQNGQLTFNLVSDLLMYNDGIYNVNVYTSRDDVPVFTDVNRDGDMDVLTYGIFGSFVEYYENQTVEHAGDPHFAVDSFKFFDQTLCWGEFTENSLNNSISLNISCKGNSPDNSVVTEGSRHAGSTIYSFDYGNDHDVDLLVGDISYNNLVFVENCGDSSYAHICVYDSLFPFCNTPVALPLFPAAYGVDANRDGLEDLLVSPNTTAGARDVDNVMFYQNTGNPSCPFQYQGDSFLVRHAMDFGTDSKPYFYDVNGDGLKDIVTGNYGYFRPFLTYKSTLAYLQNTGSNTQPEFTQVNDDFANVSNFNLVAVHPAFGDLNGDGNVDMLLGELTGTLNFFKNVSNGMASFPTMTSPQYFNLDVGEYSAPFIYDVNGDSLNDLVVGKKNGKLSYYWNYGTKTNALFSADSVNAFFGNVNVTQIGYGEGYSTPYIQQEGGALKLYVGSLRGLTFKYDLDVSKLRVGAFNLVDSNYLNADIGSKSTIAIDDLNDDGQPEYLLGNSRGGLLLYSDSLWDPDTILSNMEFTSMNSNSLRLYPNPTNQYVMVEADGVLFNHPTVEIYNLLGEYCSVEFKSNQNRIVVNTSTMPSGFYLIRLTEKDRVYSGTILISR